MLENEPKSATELQFKRSLYKAIDDGRMVFSEDSGIVYSNSPRAVTAITEAIEEPTDEDKNAGGGEDSGKNNWVVPVSVTVAVLAAGPGQIRIHLGEWAPPLFAGLASILIILGPYSPELIGEYLSKRDLRIMNAARESKGVVVDKVRVLIGYTEEEIDEKELAFYTDRSFPESDKPSNPDEDDESVLELTDGSQVPAANIETVLKKHLTAAEHVMVVGSGKEFLSCILFLKTKGSEARGHDPNSLGPAKDDLAPASVAFAQQCGSEATTVSEARMCSKFRGEGLWQHVSKANGDAPSFSQKVLVLWKI